MKLLVKKENQIFGKGVLHIEGCGEVIVKCVSAQRFSSTNSVLSVIPYDESVKGEGIRLSICNAKGAKG